MHSHTLRLASMYICMSMSSSYPLAGNASVAFDIVGKVLTEAPCNRRKQLYWLTFSFRL